MDNQPLVSILMNCYNGEKYLKEAIDSIYVQTYKNWEIIFVDNCSTDKSEEIAKSYDKKLKYHRTDKNIPLGAARNWGLQCIKGQFLAFLDTDDIWIKNKLEIQIKNLIERTAAMSFTSSYYINSNGKVIDTKILDESDEKVCNQFMNYSINMQSVVIDLDKQNIEFDESLSYAPDYKLFMSIFLLTDGNVIAEKEVLVKYRVHSNSLSSKSIDIQYSEVKHILEYFKNKFTNKIMQCKKEYQHACLLNSTREAESYLSKSMYKEASDIFFNGKSLGLNIYIKAIIFRIPIINTIFYKYIIYRRNKKLN